MKFFRRTTLVSCSGVHFIHDGLSDALYLLLPIWQLEFALNLTQVGALKSVYSGTMALLQIPAGLLAERWGERALLGIGTVLTGLAYLALNQADGYLTLLAVLLVAGAGAAVQHPLSSSIVSKAYINGSRRVALGIYNFSGDLGKVGIPLALSIIVSSLGWRWGTTSAGILGVTAGFLAFLVLRCAGAGASPGRNPDRQVAPAKSGSKDETTGWGITDRIGFSTLSLIGIIDSAGRTGFLTLLPFLLIGKGAELKTVGVALALVFGGGAMGKLVCGILAQKLGIIRTVVLSEMITGFGILLLLILPLHAALALLPIVGIGLNGTSSVLYGTVSDFVTEERRARGFGLFYALAIGGGAMAPTMFGVLSDFTGITIAMAAVATVALATIPLCTLLVRPLRQTHHTLS